MANEIFSYKSADRLQCSSGAVLDVSETNGLKCKWSYEKKNSEELDEATLTWIFDWIHWKNQRVVGFIGHINLFLHEGDAEAPTKRETFDVDLKNGNDVIKKTVSNVSFVGFEYSIIPYYISTEVYDEMFLPSNKNDATLEVGDKKLHVNKAFFSYHSDFFQALFSSNFKEGQMDEIPIKDVSSRDLGLLFSTIYPKTIFPNDKFTYDTLGKILDLADRFMVPSAIHHVEYHLLNNSKIESEKMIWMADKYGMPKLLDKMIGQLDSTTKAKKLNSSPGYSDFSDRTKGKILDQLMKIIE